MLGGGMRGEKEEGGGRRKGLEGDYTWRAKGTNSPSYASRNHAFCLSFEAVRYVLRRVDPDGRVELFMHHGGPPQPAGRTGCPKGLGGRIVRRTRVVKSLHCGQIWHYEWVEKSWLLNWRLICRVND